MSDLDSNIANGTCYYGYNQAAGDELVPCGNGGIDHVPCCFGGDYCDANNSCYDDDTGNTYIAGCTDAEYTDSSCPWKSDDFDTQEWVGLTRCDAIDEAANEYPWAGCSVPASAYTKLQKLPGTCDCTSKATLFIGEQALLRHASIPESTGGSISWVEGFEVTAVATSNVAASATSTLTSGSGTSTATATTSSTASAPASATEAGTSGGLSSGTKATIAGSVVGGVLVLAIMALMVFLHKRRRVGSETAATAPPLAKVDDIPPPAYVDGRPMELEDTAPKFSGRSPGVMELAADESRSTLTGAHRSNVGNSSVSLLGTTPELAPSEFGDARRHSMVSEMSHSDEHGGLFISSAPSSPPPRNMPSISELPG